MQASLMRVAMGAAAWDEDVRPARVREVAWFAAVPSPTVMGTGFAQIPAAIERQRQGVSAAKLVMSL